MQTRARKVITRGPIRLVGKFPSLKNGRHIHWESQLERDRVLMLEFHEDVIRYQEQPKTFTLNTNGRTKRYTPDFEVLMKNGTVYEEIKPSSQVHKFEETFTAFEKHLESKQSTFAILTEKDIRIEPLLSNIRYLLKFRILKPEPKLIALYLDALSQHPNATILEYTRLFKSIEHHEQMPYWLLSYHYFECDLHQELSPKTLLTLKRNYSCQQ